MKIEKLNIEGIKSICVTNDNNMCVTFFNLGASLYSIKINEKEMLYSPKDINEFKIKTYYYGKTIGRVAGRIKNGSWKNYRFEVNENANTLHSGNNSLHTKVFDYKITSNNNFIYVSFIINDIDGSCGFPGNLKLIVRYRIYRFSNMIEITFDSFLDKDSLINLTNHSYFTLGDKNILNSLLYINASKYIEVDEKMMPLSIKNCNKAMNFKKFKEIKEDINDNYLLNSTCNGYDHYFVFDDITYLKPQIILKNNDITLNIYTDYAGSQIYTNNYPNNIKTVKNCSDIKGSSIAIEPQKNGYNIDDLLQFSNKRVKNRIKYEFIIHNMS